MTYHTNIRHQELVALLGTRNLYLRLVYAHIANYTQVKGAWCGSKQKLADELEMERTVVSRKLEELINRGLVIVENDNYRAVCTPDRAENTEDRAESTEKRAESTEIAPLIINNKIMKSNNIIARDTIATPDPKDQTSFERLEKLFMKRIGTFQMAEAVRNDSRSLWEQYPLWKRILLLEELTNPTGQVRPRLDWTLTAFNPQPKFLSGLDQDDYWKSAEWTKNHKPLVMVEYEGLCKVCTEQTMRTFDLKFKRNVLPHND